MPGEKEEEKPYSKSRCRAFYGGILSSWFLCLFLNYEIATPVLRTAAGMGGTGIIWYLYLVFGPVLGYLLRPLGSSNNGALSN